MNNLFKITGPAIISFSGGRTSAFMLHRIVAAHGGDLPHDVKVVFTNTGKERNETLDFVRDVGEHTGIDIVWLQYRPGEESGHRYEIVTHATAARAGEPFNALIDAKGYLPNPVKRFCTSELKIRPARDYARSLGWKHWTVVLGLRADEASRVSKARARDASEKEPWKTAMPLHAAGISKRDVLEFWQRQNYDLRLPNIGGTTPAGNCDLCFLKSVATIQGLMRDNPGMADWWIEAEAEARASKPDGAKFRAKRPGYAEMQKAVLEQRPFDFGDVDRSIDCLCTEDQD